MSINTPEKFGMLGTASSASGAPGGAPASRSTLRPDNVKSAILSSSTSGWSPLRIQKRDSDSSSHSNNPRRTFHQHASAGGAQTPVRRTSSSFSHVRNNSLVTNSPFKLASPPPLSPRPSKIPTTTVVAGIGRRTSMERKASLERRVKRNFSPPSENAPPSSLSSLSLEHPSAIKRRQSKGFQSLVTAEYVSRSPFLDGIGTPSSESTVISPRSSVDPDNTSSEPQKPPTARVNASLIPSRIPTVATTTTTPLPQPVTSTLDPEVPPSTASNPFPTRSNLVSNRFYGPRSSSSSSNSLHFTKRARRKVRFNERCNVVEFDTDEFEVGSNVEFEDEDGDGDHDEGDDDDEDEAEMPAWVQSDNEVDYDPNGPRRLYSPDDEDEGDDHDEDEREEHRLHEHGRSVGAYRLDANEDDGYSEQNQAYIDEGFVGTILAREDEPTTPVSAPVTSVATPTHKGAGYKPDLFVTGPPSPSPARRPTARPLASEKEDDGDEDDEDQLRNRTRSQTGNQKRASLEPLSLSPSSKLSSALRSQSKLGESPQFLPDIAESSPFVVGLSGSVFNAQQQHQTEGQGSFSISDNAKQDSMTTTAADAASRASMSSHPKIAISKALGIETSSSIGSAESSGSIGMSGRASPRISRDEVKRRLMKTRTSAAEIDQYDDGDSEEDDSDRHIQRGQNIQDRDLPPLPPADTDDNERSRALDDLSRESMSPSPEQRLRSPNSRSLPRPTSTSSSFDLHKPGVDLGEVRSALDRLMLGVERGFVDESGSLSHDTSFMDETADSSIDYDNRNQKGDYPDADGDSVNRFSTMTDMSLGEIMGIERAVFVEAQTKRPNISPPSPLLSSASMMIPEPEPSSEHRTPSMTETETEEEGPFTPSVHSLPSPLAVIDDLPPGSHPGSLNSSRTDRYLESSHPNQQVESKENKIAFKLFGTSSSSGSMIDLNSKALPAVPQPRLSLDLSISSSFHESEFGLDPGSLSSSRALAPEVPSVNVKPPAMSGKEAIKARDDAILNKRREIRRLERGDSMSSREEPDRPASSRMDERPPQRRRSRSTGDASDVRSERAAADRSRADRGLLSISQSSSKEDIPLSASISLELSKRTEPQDKDRTYHLRERNETIYASSAAQKVSHLGSVGDIDSGKAWRTVRRPSDMNEYSREIRAYRALEKPGKAHGKVFVKVLGVRSINVPIPRLPTWFTCTLNNGIHFVTTPECRLARDSAIEQEFELIEHSKLEFTLTLKVKKDPHIMVQAKRAAAPPPAPVPAPAPVPQKSSGGMRAFFGGSPKKSHKVIPPVPAPVPSPPPPPPPVAEETIIKYLRQDGTLARTFISFKDVAPLCDTRLFETNFPLMGYAGENKSGTAMGPGPSSGNTRVVGQIVLQMFRLPPLPGIPPESLPQSLEECLRGMRHTSWHKVTYHEGILTQNGGDCSTWRRRQFRVIGAKLVAFNDVTKKATATIELRKATSVEDDNMELSPSATQASINRWRTRDSYDAGTKVERSFRLVFPDDDEIEFFADTDEEKSKWLQVFRALLGRIPPNPLWAELVWQRQQDLAAAGTGSPPPETRAPSRQR